MGAFVAWLWVFPLFGTLQLNFPDQNSQFLLFNILFLGGNATGYAVSFLIKKNALKKSLTYYAPLVNLFITSIIAFMLWVLPAILLSQKHPFSFLVFNIFPILAGMATAVYFCAWGVTIYQVSSRMRGKYMGAMMACASILTMAVLLISKFYPLLALLLAGLLLTLPAFYTRPDQNVPHNHKYKGLMELLTHTTDKNNTGFLKPLTSFWMPFSLILICFYILSWITHQSIFPLIREESLLAPVLGQGSYGLIALGGGLIMDREKEIEKIALLGLAMLGCAFLLLPAAMALQMLLPLQLLLEGSYALIDLFIWVILAFAASLLKGNPRQYYSMGLFLNIIFIIAGLALTPILTLQNDGPGIFYLSMVAGVILFMGTLPALALRKIRVSHESNPRITEQISKEIDALLEQESFTLGLLTQKEKEVLSLMLAGFQNAHIEEKLSISKNTLKTHIRHIYEKTGTKNRSELRFKFGGYALKD